MGKIKSKMMRRTVKDLKNKGIGFSEEFNMNKKILGNTMPSKKLRNRIAGLASRHEKQKRKELPTIRNN